MFNHVLRDKFFDDQPEYETIISQKNSNVSDKMSVFIQHNALLFCLMYWFEFIVVQQIFASGKAKCMEVLRNVLSTKKDFLLYL